MSEPNPYSPPAASLEAPPEPVIRPANNGPEGLRGWLVLLGFAIVISPFRLLISTFQTYVPLVREGTLQTLFSSAGPTYNLPLGTLIIIEFFVNVGLVIALIYIAILFLRKSRQFPRAFIIFYLVSIGVIIADTVVIRFLAPGSEDDPAYYRAIVRAVIGACIWIPYTLRSVRVKNTFIER